MVHRLTFVTAAAATAALAAVAAFAQVAPPQTPSLADLPAAIKPPAELKVYIEAAAKGVQIYNCGKNDSGAFAWTLKGPDASLMDTHQKPLGKHYAGPTWEDTEGGKVVGAAKANAPASSANSVPWLLLDIKSRSGSGPFSQAQAILRVATNGGAAPPTGCDEAHTNTENRIPYTATYLFLK
jgi:hypothetical protein